MAVFTSRTKSKTAAKAWAVLRSSDSPASKSVSAFSARLRIATLEPAGNCSDFSRETKFRRRRTELSACLKLSEVKLSWRRYGTESNRKRMVEGFLFLAKRSRNV